MPNTESQKFESGAQPHRQLAAALLISLLALAALFAYRVWAPKGAGGKGDGQGPIQTLGQLCYQESQAFGGQKDALDAEIRSEAASIHDVQLPPKLQACVDHARGM